MIVGVRVIVGVFVTVGVYVLVAEGVSEGVEVDVFVGVMLGVGVAVLNKPSDILHPDKIISLTTNMSINNTNALRSCPESKNRLLKMLMHKYSPEQPGPVSFL